MGFLPSGCKAVPASHTIRFENSRLYVKHESGLDWSRVLSSTGLLFPGQDSAATTDFPGRRGFQHRPS